MIKNALGLLLIVLLLVAGQQQKICASEEMTPGEILQRADESRGNLEGIQWKVMINSIEKGREQKRKIKVKAKGYDFLALLTAPTSINLPSCLHELLRLLNRIKLFSADFLILNTLTHKERPNLISLAKTKIGISQSIPAGFYVTA